MTSTDTTGQLSLWRELFAIAAVLAVIAVLAPAPWYATDRGTYERVGREWVAPDCADLHCFRVLVAWVVESMPGPSLVWWKTYAVLANAGAGVAVSMFALALGFSHRAARLGGWLSALGFGSMFTLFDPHSSDPLMYFMGPAIATLLVRERFAAAGWLATLGIFAKEFAAAPLWIFAFAESFARRWATAARVGIIAATVMLVWIGLQLFLMLRFNYSYGESASADLLGGGYLRHWTSYVSPRVAAATIFGEYGAVFVLLPWGIVRCGPDLRRMLFASIPAVVALAYVQQPDRALWNFHFLLIPVAVVVLERLPSVFSWLFVACYATANLRIGAQLSYVPSARFALAASVLLALAAIGLDVRDRVLSGQRARISAT